MSVFLQSRVPLSMLLGLALTANVGGCSSSDPATDGDDGSEVRPETGDDGGAKNPPVTDGGLDAAPDDPQVPFACPGGAVAPGANELTVDGKKRTFFAEFPADTSKPMAVIFSWHGFGDTGANFRKAAKLNPNQDPAVPAIIVTPDDTGLQPFGSPQGLDWDIAAGKPGDKNIDLPFFEAMLGCLSAQHAIDDARIYSLGFSAGSVFTSLLHSRYPKRIAAIAALSGVWMNDGAQTALIKGIKVDWSWPGLDPAHGGNVLLTHGGPNDTTVLNIMNLEAAAQAAFPFLKAANRTVVDCAHDKGHTLHPELTPALVSKYLFAHRLGEPSPYAGADLAAQGFPASCKVRLP